jgi:hypothetical protein
MGGAGLSLLLVQLGVSALVGASLAIAMALTVGVDRAFQAQLFDARNGAHVYELLHGEESEDFNYFLED